MAVATYMANAIGGMLDGWHWVRWLSPFHYFIGTDPLHTGWHPAELLALVAPRGAARPPESSCSTAATSVCNLKLVAAAPAAARRDRHERRHLAGRRLRRSCCPSRPVPGFRQRSTWVPAQRMRG